MLTYSGHNLCERRYTARTMSANSKIHLILNGDWNHTYIQNYSMNKMLEEISENIKSENQVIPSPGFIECSPNNNISWTLCNTVGRAIKKVADCIKHTSFQMNSNMLFQICKAVTYPHFSSYKWVYSQYINPNDPIRSMKAELGKYEKLHSFNFLQEKIKRILSTLWEKLSH